jgi:uncharacterized protein involved in exopolysaccharide biosynthesis
MTSTTAELSAPPTTMQGGDVIDLLRRRRMLVIIPFLIVLGIGLVLSFALPPKYQARATIEVVDRQLLDKFFQQVDFTLPHKPYLTTIADVIKSPAFLREIIERLGITEGFNPADAVQKARLVQRVMDSTSVHLTEQTVGPDILELSYVGRDPAKVIAYVNAVASKYKNYVLDTYKGEIARARRNLIARRDSAKLLADKALADYESFQTNNDFQLIGDNVLTSRLNELARQREQVAIEEVREQGLVERLEHQRAGVTQTPTETVLRTQKRNPEYEAALRSVRDAEAGLEDLRKRATELHPDWSKLARLVEAAKAKLAATPEMVDEERAIQDSRKFEDLDKGRRATESELREVRARIARLKDSITNLEGVTKAIPGLTKQAWNLKNARDNSSEELRRFDSSLQSANGLWERVNAEGGDFFRDLRVPVMEEASTMEKSFPSTPLFAGVGAFVGLLFGGALALFAEFASSSYTSAAQLRRTLAVPVLGEVMDVADGDAQARSAQRSRVWRWALGVAAILAVVVHLAYFVPALVNLLPPDLYDFMARIYGGR